ncbi:MAG: radical SAM/Cys-rich protein [Gammaproteobacteria bacterium]|jgi:radical SAM/Cys-rich protein
MEQHIAAITRAPERVRFEHDFPPIRRATLETLQVNLGYRCNQACTHCHVDAGPNRTEEMSLETIDLVLKFAASRRIRTLDLTGGAPELNPHFRTIVSAARGLQLTVIDRCNLTILEEPGQQGLAQFLAGNQVQVTASMPCHSRENVDLQRGKGVFEKSIRGLLELNALGYGMPGSALELNLVYNPTGPFLPPSQVELERTYRDELERNFGIQFSRLLTLANMPIARFRHSLARDHELENYLNILHGAHQDANLDQVMCRTTISVDWQGDVYDCDFNQMLKMPFGKRNGPTHLCQILDTDLDSNPISVADHCFACTAGQGSSCSGALVK